MSFKNRLVTWSFWTSIVAALAQPFSLGCGESDKYLLPRPIGSNIEQKVDESRRFALVIVDMQPKFWDRVNSYEREEELPNQIEVVRYCNQHKIPIVVLEYLNGGNTIEELTDEVEKNPNYRCITKRKDDGFENTGLDIQLREWGTNSVLLMGVNAGSCVAQTANAANKKGYQIWTAQDLVANGDWESERNDYQEYFKRIGQYSDDYREILPHLR